MENKTTEKEIETMRLFIAESLMILSSAQCRADAITLDDLAAKAACFMTGREAAEIIREHDIALENAVDQSILAHDRFLDGYINEDSMHEQAVHSRQERRDGWQPVEAR